MLLIKRFIGDLDFRSKLTLRNLEISKKIKREMIINHIRVNNSVEIITEPV